MASVPKKEMKQTESKHGIPDVFTFKKQDLPPERKNLNPIAKALRYCELHYDTLDPLIETKNSIMVDILRSLHLFSFQDGKKRNIFHYAASHQFSLMTKRLVRHPAERGNKANVSWKTKYTKDSNEKQKEALFGRSGFENDFMDEEVLGRESSPYADAAPIHFALRNNDLQTCLAIINAMKVWGGNVENYLSTTKILVSFEDDDSGDLTSDFFDIREYGKYLGVKKSIQDKLDSNFAKKNTITTEDGSSLEVTDISSFIESICSPIEDESSGESPSSSESPPEEWNPGCGEGDPVYSPQPQAPPLTPSSSLIYQLANMFKTIFMTNLLSLKENSDPSYQIFVVVLQDAINALFKILIDRIEGLIEKVDVRIEFYDLHFGKQSYNINEAVFNDFVTLKAVLYEVSNRTLRSYAIPSLGRSIHEEDYAYQVFMLNSNNPTPPSERNASVTMQNTLGLAKSVSRALFGSSFFDESSSSSSSQSFFADNEASSSSSSSPLFQESSIDLSTNNSYRTRRNFISFHK